MDRLRMCVACRQHKDKRELKRVIRSPEGTICVDETGKKSGRGAYVCSKECLAKSKKHRLLNKAFKCEVPDEIFDRLLEEF